MSATSPPRHRGADRRLSLRFFVFARHAESAANVAHVISSDPVHDPGLTRRGERQARLLGEQLAHLPVDLAVCTRFRRTQQTIGIVLGDRNTPLRIEPDLDEVDAGAFDGAAIAEYWAWKDLHSRDEPFPGGESLAAACGRYANALRRLLGRDDRVTLVVCHEMALRAILAAAHCAPCQGMQASVANAVPYLLDPAALQLALTRLETAARAAAGAVDVAA